MTKKHNVPQIRFKGFNEAWEQRRLGDLLVLLKDGTHGTHADSSSGYFLLSAKNIKDGTVHYDETDRIISEDDVKIIQKNYSLLFGDVLLTIVGTIGETAIVEEEKKYVFQRSVAILRTNELLNNKFLRTSLLTPTIRKQLQAKQSLSAQPGVYLGDIETINLSYPDLREQKQIACSFEALDTLITLHQRKLDSLKNIKKALLEKMFPSDGQAFPAIRFKGFADAWEQRRLAQEVSFSKGSGYSKSDLSDEGQPLILYGRLYTNYEAEITEVDTFATAKPGSVFSSGNEVIVPASGETAEDIARASSVKTKGCMIGGDLNILVPTSNIDSTFLAISISHGFVSKKLASMAQGKSVVHIHNSDIEQLNVLFPSLSEQVRIVGVFRRIDTLITLHQRKLDSLKNIKKALLEKMFV